jgi:drug/metabolite transporter (DMT)-like permease
MVGSAFAFSVMVFLIKTASTLEPVSAPEAVFLRSLPMAFLCVGILSYRKEPSPRPREVRWLLSRGAIGATSMLCLFYSGLHIPLAMTSLLQNTSVFFMAFLAHFLLGERMGVGRALAVAGGFASVALILGEGLRGSFQALDPWKGASGYIVGLLSGFLSAAAYFSVRKLKDLSTHWIILSLSLFGCLIPLVSFVFFAPHWPTTPLVWALLLGSSVPAIFGQYALTLSLSRAPSTSVSLGQYAGPLFSTALGFLFLGEGLSIYKMLGGVLLIAFAVSLSFLRKAPHER